MSTYGLDKLFSPRSVALIGASPRRTWPGHAVLRNLKAGNFSGPIEFVNPHYAEIGGGKSRNRTLTARNAPLQCTICF
jgi:acetyltransferase